MRLLALLLIFLQATTAEWTTVLSFRYSDVLKIKCDALPYRSLTFDGKCYFVIGAKHGQTGASKQCSRVVSGAQFHQPVNVPKQVWDSLFVDQNMFVSDRYTNGKTKIMCSYESPGLEFANLPQSTVVGNATARLEVMKTMCFRRKTSTVRKVVIDSQNVIDEYHCKMICAEIERCFSFIYCTGKCTILGEKKADFVCGNTYHEWVKKTTDADCPDNIEQPSIDFFGYSPNPELAPPRATKIDDIKNISLGHTWPCPPQTVIDTTLPDNSHRVEGATCSGVHWDAKLGSWMFIKRPVEGPVKIYYYVRSVRCYKADPTKFSDTTKCGGTLPLSKPQDISLYRSTYPVSRYGVKKVCASTRDTFACSIDCRTYFEMSFDGDIGNMISCIDGSWIWFDHWGNTAKPIHGFCGVYKN